MSKASNVRIRGGALALTTAAAVGLPLTGCMIGPDYKRPPVATTAQWREVPTTQATTQPTAAAPTAAEWWKSFDDPVLDRLIDTAYHQNLPLRTVGLRVLEARAARGIAVGTFFPQQQSVNGSYTTNGLSKNNAIQTNPRHFESTAVSFDVAWEMDVWGKFRRGIESADAAVLASVMNYDDALVTLAADVATAYVDIRSLDERIALARANVVVQQEALEIANVRFRAGGTTELDVQQARAQLTDTQALVPALEVSRRQAENQLCILLGIPPQDLSDVLQAEAPKIPSPPDSVAVGIPADLLRRRPDVRRAEALAAAQSAQIGVAKADLLPRFQLFGSIGYTADSPSDVFNPSSLAYQAGPGFRWDILNYGRITNNVRIQDARFEQALTDYQNTVLRAQRDVNNAITSLVRSQEQAAFLSDSVTASLRSVQLSLTQYRAGGADFVRVLNATAFLVQEQERLVVSRANIGSSAIALNRSLGGGWEMRGNDEFVPPEVIQRMRARTDWGDITSSDYAKKRDMAAFPRSGTESVPHK